MSRAAIAVDIERDGFEIRPGVLAPECVSVLTGALSRIEGNEGAYDRGGVYAARGLLERVPEVAQLARSRTAEELVAPILGEGWRPVRAIYFDKTPNANWKVPWHQDLTIAVKERHPVEGFGPWSVKAGVPHVQPPVGILEQMLAVRFALDDNGTENGPLRVLPGTHRLGRLSADQIQELRASRPEVACCVLAGDALLMRPLLLHASSAMTVGARRRVIHIEYAGCDLPDGLEWNS